MRKLNFTLIALTLGFVLVACQNSEKKEDKSSTETQKAETKKVVVKEVNWERLDVDLMLKDYLKIKDELVKDNLKGTGKQAYEMIKHFEDYNYDRVPEAHVDFAKHIVRDAKEVAMKIESGSSLKEKRKHFYHLSEIMTKYVMTVEPDQPLYEQYCPMYADNRGASWLSLDKEIRNPFFGSQMLKCGEVTKKH
ncbi:MAG: DUF3347 domain-containing protein [Flavobacteriaceae bacterium]